MTEDLEALKRLKELQNESEILEKTPDLDRVDKPLLALLYNDCYEPFKNADQVAQRMLQVIMEDRRSKGKSVSYPQTPAKSSPVAPNTTVSVKDFAHFLQLRSSELERTFKDIQSNCGASKTSKGIGLEDLLDYMDRNSLNYDPDQVELLYHALDRDNDGVVGLQEFKHQLMLLPLAPNCKSSPLLLQSAYKFFVDDLEFSSDSDVLLASESRNGFGYFWAGGFAGVVSRTCTAPFDRLKVFLIASSTVPVEKVSLWKAVRILYAAGGVRNFFVGNGLNVFKVFPESAIKFGSFETAKKIFASIEGVEDPADISRWAIFVAGGLGGMVSQLCVYPIDTIKFRVQCAGAGKDGSSVVVRTIKDMVRNGGITSFYRGITVGVLGIFPFAALDLGIFSALKRAYIARKARQEDIDPQQVEMGNMVVLTMGALSGSVGASVVYPVNLLRTRIQTQGTPAHPQRYTGFLDVYRKTLARDGFRGFFRGLGPNLAKVAPSVSISYLVYENAKSFMGLH